MHVWISQWNGVELLAANRLVRSPLQLQLLRSECDRNVGMFRTKVIQWWFLPTNVQFSRIRCWVLTVQQFKMTYCQVKWIFFLHAIARERCKFTSFQFTSQLNTHTNRKQRRERYVGVTEKDSCIAGNVENFHKIWISFDMERKRERAGIKEVWERDRERTMVANSYEWKGLKLYLLYA